MPALSHIGFGLAAKRATPTIPAIVLVVAVLALDILAGVFWLAGITAIIPAANLSWSHGLFMALFWSLIGALVAGLIFQKAGAGLVIGSLVFSHWLFDFLMWPPNPGLLYFEGPAIGLNLG